MAHVVTGSIVADISGKVGDSVYSRNRGGLYVKKYVKPVQPSSSYQQTALLYFQAANVAYNQLSESDYSNWAAFTKKIIKSTFNGSQRPWTPRGLFIHCFVNRQFIGFPTNPLPVMPAASGFQSLTLEQVGTLNLYATTIGGVTNTDFYTIYKSHFATSLGVRSINSVQQVFFHSRNYKGIGPENIAGTWKSRFSPTLPLATQRSFCSVDIIHKDSGIRVGTGWDSSVGAGSGTAFDLGVTSIPSGSITMNFILAQQVTPVQNGQINSVSLYIQSGSSNVQVGVWADLSGKPDILLGQSTIIASTSTLNFETFPLLVPVPISASVPVWIGLIPQTSLNTKAVFSGPLAYWDYNTPFALPSPFPVSKSFSREYSLYCSGFYF